MFSFDELAANCSSIFFKNYNSLLCTQILLAALLAGLLPATIAIECFECDSSQNFSCTEFWDPSLAVVQNFTSNCRHVFEAEYCVKMTGVFEGKLGTKRFCSSRDWGNYCEYIKRPGDIQVLSSNDPHEV